MLWVVIFFKIFEVCFFFVFFVFRKRGLMWWKDLGECLFILEIESDMKIYLKVFNMYKNKIVMLKYD